MTDITKTFNTFFENTKQVYSGIGISLLIIIIFIIVPLNIYKPYLIIVKLIIVTGLCFLLYKNTLETHNLLKNTNISLNNKLNSPIKNSIILSYVLSLVIFVLIIYVFYGIFQ